MAQKQAKRKTARRKAQNSRVIGYTVLGLGVLALFSVCGLVGFRYGLGGAVLQGIGMESYAEGDWVSDFGDYHAVFQAHDGTYQILALAGHPVKRRYYARGTTRVDGDILTLIPDAAMGVPESKDAAIPYTELTSGAFAIQLRRQGHELVWLTGPPTPARRDLNPAYPLLQYSGTNVIVWRPMEE